MRTAPALAKNETAPAMRSKTRFTELVGIDYPIVGKNSVSDKVVEILRRPDAKFDDVRLPSLVA